MYRIWNNPAQRTDPVEFPRLEDVLNVKVNKTWRTGAYTVKSFIDQLKFMVNRDFVKYMIQTQSWNNTLPSGVNWETYITHIADEDLWTLLFYQMDASQVYIRKFTVMNDGSSNPTLYQLDAVADRELRWLQEERRRTGEAGWVTIRKTEDKVKLMIAELIANFGNSKIGQVSSAFTLAPDILSKMVYYAADKEVLSFRDMNPASDQRRRSVRPSWIAALPNAVYETVASHYGLYQGEFVLTYETRSSLYRVFQYSQNVLSLLQPKKLDGEPDSTIKFGVELELATDYPIEALIDAADDPFFIAKSDSSVSGNKRNKLELVTPPMTALAQKVYWAQWFDNLSYSMFDTSLETTNGMHVHIGNPSFKDAHHRRQFIWFFARPQNTEFMLRFSARSLESFKRYSPVPPIHQGETEDIVVQDIDALVARTRDDHGNPLRGIVAASKRGGTTEVRLFRGVVSLADITKNLEMVEAAYQFTAQERNPKNLTLQNFLAFVADSPADDWEILKEYLNTLDLDYCQSYSEVFDVVFGEHRPEQMGERIRRAYPKFEANDVHATCLNMHFGRKFFSYKDGEVKVKTQSTSGSAVARFDGHVAAKYNKKRPLRKRDQPLPFAERVNLDTPVREPVDMEALYEEQRSRVNEQNRPRTSDTSLQMREYVRRMAEMQHTANQHMMNPSRSPLAGPHPWRTETFGQRPSNPDTPTVGRRTTNTESPNRYRWDYNAHTIVDDIEGNT